MPFTDVEKAEVMRRLKVLEEDKRTLERIIKGQDDSDEPGGIIWRVMENTKFRKLFTAWLWLLTVISTGIVIEKVIQVFGGN